VAIQITLDRVLEDRGMTLTELSDRIGVTLANLSILKTNKARAIRFSTLDALCRELRCQPGDLLAFSGRAGGSVFNTPPNKRLQPTARR
jgi:putative transcriptional regulator